MELGRIKRRLGTISLSLFRGDRAALQNARLRAQGLGWRAERCLDPRSCELDLCVADDAGRQWHPVEPLAFAKWRVWGNPDAMPPEVIVRTRRGGVAGLATEPRVMFGALGVGGLALAAAFLLARQAGGRRACSA